MTLARDAGDGGAIAVAGVFLGHVEYAAGDVNAAFERFTNSLAAFRALAVPWGIGNSLTGLALVTGAIGDRDHAERLLDEATAVLRQSGPWYLSLVLTARAILAVSRGETDAALAFAREALGHTRELHDKFAFVHAVAPFAAASVLKGNDISAARLLGARDVVSERTGVVVVEQAIHDLCAQAERHARARLGSERWSEAYAAGRRLSIDALLTDIDTRPAVVE